MKDFPVYGYFLIGIPLFMVGLLLFCPIPFTIADSERIGLAQLVIETAGLVAVGFAVWEFSKAQRRPKLDLWLSIHEPSNSLFSPTKELTDKLHRPSSHRFRFHIVLENYGKSIARWVKGSLVLTEPGNNIQCHFKLASNDSQKFWDPPQGDPSWLHKFDGRESFIIYSEERGEKHRFGECELLGTFEISVADFDGNALRLQELTIHYSIKADGVEEITGKFLLHLSEN